jgi:predicted nucleic acid-binding protein
MKKAMWLIDSDVLIDYLRGIPQAVIFLKQTMANSVCHISAITVAELYAGVREGKERSILDPFIQEFQVVVVSEKIAQQGGLFKRKYGKSHGVGLADAVIAATAEDLSVGLITLNEKHYPMLKDVYVPYQKSGN